MSALDKLPQKAQARDKLELKKIFSAFVDWCNKGSYQAAKKSQEREWECMLCQFSKGNN